MSRLTAAEVINLGEYLNADFEPASLTVSQLLGILGYHNIQYPTPYTKQKLIHQFNNEVKPRSEKFKKERRKRLSAHASDDGILDGVTGKPVGGGPSLGKRSSKRISRAPAEEAIPAAKPEQPKRRRSSAQPTLGGPSRNPFKGVQAAVLEESEPEEDLPVRKVGRSGKSAGDAGSQARRVSQFGEDSGWEDNNIFQSGAESSSPLRPSPPARSKAPRSKSLGSRGSRKSMSAPPQISSPAQAEDTVAKPPSQPTFEPRLPPDIVSRKVDTVASSSTNTNTLPFDHTEADELNIVDGNTGVAIEQAATLALEASESQGELDDELLDDADSIDRISDEEQYAIAVSRRIAEGGRLTSRRKRDSISLEKPMSLQMRLFLAFVLLAASIIIFNYKQESVQIGFCDTGKATNAFLDALKERRNAVETCNRENRTYLHVPPRSEARDNFVVSEEEELCPPPSPIPIPRPANCTPCPSHATCTRDTITCDNGYLLRSHPLLWFLEPVPSRGSIIEFSSSLAPSEMIWKIVSEALDGLPSFGSVALPPRCAEDPKRKRNIGILGKHIEAILGQERGRRLCAGVPPEVEDKEGGEARRWGFELEELWENLKQKVAPKLVPTFDDTFHEAIQQLILWGGVIIGEDAKKRRYLAHQTPDLTWHCAITVKVRDLWAQWRATVIGVVTVIIAAYFGKLRRARQRTENKRVAELVTIALDALRNQELAHHTDPVRAPQPYLSSLQLRDLILQDEHSVSARATLWKKVEKVVEGNVNVRTNLEELNKGDEMRVWRWIGGSGLRKRLTLQMEEK